MMPESKYLHLSVALSSILVLSGCSGLDLLKFDTVDDTVNYQQAAGSVRSLAIPPGLSNPGFDQTYASANGKVSQASVENVAALAKPTATPKIQAQNRQNVMRSNTAVVKGRAGSSLGAALMAQSESDSGKQQASAPAARTQSFKSNVTTVVMPQVTMIKLKGGEPALAINAPRAKAWELLAPTLSGAGFGISKQQPTQGIVTVNYKGQDRGGLRKGQNYLILLAENASKQSFIGVANANGRPAASAIAQTVLQLVKAQFQK